MASLSVKSIEHCKNCYFWKIFDLGEGQCKRHSPLALNWNDEPEVPLWPITRELDWCGDFKNAANYPTR